MSKLFIPNFTIYATLPSEDFSVDPETGNYVSSPTILEIKAWMKRSKRQSSPINKGEDHQVDFNTVYLSGYAVTPRLIPPRTLLVDERYKAIYLEPITGTQQEGTFLFAPQVDENRPRVAKALARAVGTQLQGTFVTRNF